MLRYGWISFPWHTLCQIAHLTKTVTIVFQLNSFMDRKPPMRSWTSCGLTLSRTTGHKAIQELTRNQTILMFTIVRLYHLWNSTVERFSFEEYKEALKKQKESFVCVTLYYLFVRTFPTSRNVFQLTKLHQAKKKIEHIIFPGSIPEDVSDRLLQEVSEGHLTLSFASSLDNIKIIFHVLQSETGLLI